MKFYEVLAIIGAFAWLPFIINLVREKLKKPKLKIIPDKQIEIGYTTLGPIFNINLAFLSENKSSLITAAELELIHESNEHTYFSWIWLEESLFQMDLPKIPVFYKKNQKAIALNVNENVLVEKRIGFQNSKFKEDADKLLKAVNEDTVNLKNSCKPLTELKSLSSYNKVIDYAQSAFQWKTGLYEAKFKVYLAETDISFERTIKFQLSNQDLKTIHKNIESCKKFFEKVYINVNDELDDKWEWITVNSLSETELIRINNQKDV
jgi:hypothetical protein